MPPRYSEKGHDKLFSSVSQLSKMQQLYSHTALVLQQWRLIADLLGAKADIQIDGNSLVIPHVIVVSRYVMEKRGGFLVNC
jgi:hypothetical protein